MKRPTKIKNQPHSPLRWLAVIMVLAVFGCVAFALVLQFFSCAGLPNQSIFDFLSQFIFLSWPIFAVLGLLIVFYQPQNRIGWLCLVIGISGSTANALDYYTTCNLANGNQGADIVFAAWLYYAVLPISLVASMFIYLPMLFPDGTFLSPRWRRLAVIVLVGLVITTVPIALAPDLREPNSVGSTFPLDNPFAAVPREWSIAASPLLNLIMISGPLLAILSMIVRFRRSRGDERQQLKWIVTFLATVAVYLVIFELLGFQYFSNNPELAGTDLYNFYLLAYGIVLILVFVGFPVVIGLTIFKYRLYDIDIIIRRTLQYSIVSAVLLVVYFGSITLIQSGFTAVTNTESPLAIVISTLLIAALFNPLRHRVQDGIDRRFFRKKYDAQQVLAQFAQTTRDEVDMAALQAELLWVVQQTMQPQTVSLWMKGDQLMSAVPAQIIEE